MKYDAVGEAEESYLCGHVLQVVYIPMILMITGQCAEVGKAAAATAVSINKIERLVIMKAGLVKMQAERYGLNHKNDG